VYEGQIRVVDISDGDVDYSGLFEEGPNVKFKTFSSFPFVLRDIAVWTPEGTNAEDVLETIKKEGGDLLVQSRLFDEFSKSGRTSYAFKLVFQSMDKTLTDPEVNEVMGRITSTLNSNPDHEVR